MGTISLSIVRPTSISFSSSQVSRSFDLLLSLIDENQLEGTIPKVFGKFVHLRELYPLSLPLLPDHHFSCLFSLEVSAW